MEALSSIQPGTVMEVGRPGAEWRGHYPTRTYVARMTKYLTLLGAGPAT